MKTKFNKLIAKIVVGWLIMVDILNSIIEPLKVYAKIRDQKMDDFVADHHGHFFRLFFILIVSILVMIFSISVPLTLILVGGVGPTIVGIFLFLLAPIIIIDMFFAIKSANWHLGERLLDILSDIFD